MTVATAVCENSHPARAIRHTEVLPGQSPEDAAVAEGGALVDPGPYSSYEEANDALDQLEISDEDA